MIDVFALPPLPEPLASIMRKPKPGEPRTAFQQQMDMLMSMTENPRSGPFRDILMGADAKRVLRLLGVPDLQPSAPSVMQNFLNARSPRRKPAQEASAPIVFETEVRIELLSLPREARQEIFTALLASLQEGGAVVPDAGR